MRAMSLDRFAKMLHAYLNTWTSRMVAIEVPVRASHLLQSYHLMSSSLFADKLLARGLLITESKLVEVLDIVSSNAADLAVAKERVR